MAEMPSRRAEMNALAAGKKPASNAGCGEPGSGK
jgi:hypothetical protein